jgi:hypothetical protein
MTYVPGSKLADTAETGGGSHSAAAIEGRVAAAIAACQTFLVVRILSVLLAVGLLPLRLPNVTFRLDAAHAVVLPLGGLNRGVVLFVVGLVSAVELYLVYRLAERDRVARFLVLVIESCAIVIATVGLALGASFALLPLAASVGATCLLLLNQVRWAFRLRPQQRSLSGRRQGGTFAGYAPLSLETPKARQRIEYRVRGGAEEVPEEVPTGGAAVAARIDGAVPPRAPGGPGAWPATPSRPGG